MDIDEIKKLTLQGIMRNERLMYGLILKGGNALHLAYDLTNRGSIDIDFSMDGDFTKEEYKEIEARFSDDLNYAFNEHNIKVYDIHFVMKPKQGSIPEWKGYMLEFKLTSMDDYEKFDIEKVRRESIKVKGQSTKYTVDISSYEYVEKAEKREIAGMILRVYTPEMILIEKLRALCQSLPEYKKIVTSARQKQRARDIYDIDLIKNNFQRLDINKELVQSIFDAKRVPVNFLANLESLREKTRNAWGIVEQTIDVEEELEPFDFYFDRMIDTANTILVLLDNEYSSL